MKIIEKIEACLPTLELLLAKEGISEFAYRERALYFYGLGTYIRNELLYEGGELFSEFAKNGIDDRDAQSAFVIELLCLYLQEKKRKKTEKF